jgi:hypothetical protein
MDNPSVDMADNDLSQLISNQDFQSRLLKSIVGRESLGPNSPIPRQSSMFRDDATLRKAISALSGAGVLQVLLDEAEKVPYKTKKRFGTHNDHEFVQKLVDEMNSILHHQFLQVDFKCSARDIYKSNWNEIVAVRRSDGGTTGTFFIQCQDKDNVATIVVAKPVTLEDFHKNVFVNELCNRFFQIKCPGVRYIKASDEEYSELEAGLKCLFLPLNEELYELGGHHSPKGLFSTQGIMLLEFVKGKALCHRSKGQRILEDADYHSLGKVFLLDLLIRNTDRLPCSKVMPRPGSKVIEDHGNAGNIMFGDRPGELWSIDPEVVTNIDSAVEEVYGGALESVVLEIINHETEDDRFKAINNLFYKANPGLIGILDVSLNESSKWSRWNSAQREGANFLLGMIRLQAHADGHYIIKRAGNSACPDNDDEKPWREWIRIAVPRAIPDVLHFLEVYTGHSTPSYAFNSFQAGFVDSILAALQFQDELQDPDSDLSREFFETTSALETSYATAFILRMIDRVRKLFAMESYQQLGRKLNRSRRMTAPSDTGSNV